MEEKHEVLEVSQKNERGKKNGALISALEKSDAVGLPVTFCSSLSS